MPLNCNSFWETRAKIHIALKKKDLMAYRSFTPHFVLSLCFKLFLFSVFLFVCDLVR